MSTHYSPAATDGTGGASASATLARILRLARHQLWHLSSPLLWVLLLALLLPWVTRAQAPTISSFGPGSGPAGTSVTITGTNLGAVTGVRFGTGTLAANFVSQSATSLTVRVPVVSSTGVITLTNNAGAGASSATAFAYTPVSLVAVLSPAGPLDGCQPRTLTASATSPGFATGIGFNSAVNSVAVQADGRVLAGGRFTSYNGTTANRLVRLNADGTLDASFATGAGFDGTVNSVAVQADGKVLVGGGFSSYNGTTGLNRLVRLNADGTLDASFATGAGFDGTVNSVALQADGKVLAGGAFGSYNGTTGQNGLVRLNADGSRDASFATGTGFNREVNSVALQADGKVLVGGRFFSYNSNSTSADRLVRLNTNGTFDASFATGAGFNNPVLSVAVQADGKVLAGGTFFSYNGTSASRFVRLNTNGTLDASFATGAGFDTEVYSVAVQADGKVLVGGAFGSYNGTTAERLVRLNADGSHDASFATSRGFEGIVNSVAMQADGKVLVGGSFQRYNSGTVPNCLVRLNVDGGLNTTATAVSGASFTFSPGNRTTNPLVTSTAGSYTVTASFNGETSGASNTVVLTACPPPTISSFTPVSGPAGTPVTITGTNLDAVTGVRFGTGTLTTNFVSQSATSLTVRVPVVSSTGVITLTNNAGAGASSATAFAYTPVSLVAALSPAGPLDGCQPRTLTASATSPGFATGAGFNGTVRNVVVQADGKVLVGGQFSSYNNTGANSLVRLNADGSRDASFATGTGFNGAVLSMAVQADGKVLVGGAFSSYNNTTGQNKLVRLNADGTLDAGFATGAGFNSDVLSVALQADGKVLVGGFFTSYNGTTANRFVRLNADGTLDTGFATGAGFNNIVYSVAVQADGKVLVGGGFSSYNGTAANSLVRLNADGIYDAGFATGAGFNNGVTSVAVQADGKVLVGGGFTSYNNTTGQNRLVRLNADGSRDASLATGGGFNSDVTSLAVQADGKVLVGGVFATYQSATAVHLVRLNANGSRDAGFATGLTNAGFGNSFVTSVAVQGNGKVLAGGDFTSYNGTAANRLVRLNVDGGLNTTATAVSGAAFTFSPGNTTTNPLVTSTAGSYTATASFNGETSGPSNAVVLTACPPSISNLNPTSGPIGTSVTLTGTGFTSGATVSFNGTAATSVIFTSATSLAALVPAGASSGNVTVTTADGTSNGASFTVIVLPPPTITALSPGRGAMGSSFTLTGTNLAGTTSVRLGGQPAAFVVNSSTRLTVTVPRGASTHKVQVSIPGGTALSSVAFGVDKVNSYNFPAVTPGFNGINGGNNSAPAFTDLDGDGLLDMTVGNGLGTLSHYEQSAANSTAFALVTASFNGIFVNGNSAPAFTDLDGDGLLDMLVGTQGGEINHYEQSAANSTAFTRVTASFNGIDVGSDSKPAFTDLDGDGLLDMLVGARSGQIEYYEQSAANSTAFTRVTASFNGINVGSNSAPAVTDLDGDGLLDLLVGNGLGTLSHYEQSAANSTSFALVTASFNGNNVGRNSAPAITDLDGDGLLDLLVGEFDGNLNHYEQQALSPTLTSLSPASGPVGTSVTLTGSDLTGATAVTFAGTSNNAVTTGLTVGGTGSSQTLTVSVPTGAATGNVTVTTPNGTSNGLAFGVTTLTPTTWTGLVSTDWFTAGNWTAGVPSAFADATIPASVPGFPLISAGTASAKTLTLNTGAGLTHTGGTLDLSGDLVNNGTFTGFTATTGGSVQLSGATTQLLGGSSSTRFYNLTVGTGGATQSTAVEIVRVLALAGNLTTNGNALTLLSSPRGDALVNNNAGGVVIGTATVQRYITPSQNAGPGYRHYSSPVATTTVADLATSGFAPEVSQAATYNASATPGTTTPFPTVFGYDQSRVALSNTYAPFDRGFVVPAATATPLAVGRGYAVNIAGNQLVDFVGTLNTGSVTQTLSRGAGPEAGWHLVGNPYPSPLDMSLMPPTDRFGLDGASYVFESSSQYGGFYRSFINGVGGNPVIPSGQGFFVRVAAGQASSLFTFRNSQRLTTPNATTFQRPTAETRPLVQLTLRGATSVASDEAYVYAEAGSTVGFDSQYDAVKLLNSNGLNLSLTAAGQELAINGLPVFAPGTVVPLSVGVPVAGAYTLRVAQMVNLPAGTAAVLVDTQLNTRTDLATLPAAGYAFGVTAAQATALLTGRFYLNLVATGPLATSAGRMATSLQLYPNPAHAGTVMLVGAVPGAVVTVFDALGRQLLTATANATGSAALVLPTGLSTGVYVVRAGNKALRLTVE